LEKSQSAKIFKILFKVKNVNFMYPKMANENFSIKIISAGETRNLRQLILRPSQKAEELIFPGDDDEKTVHFGLYYNDRLSGIASLYNETSPIVKNDFSWRLRGMATTLEVRGMGFGKELMNICIEHIKSENGKIFWCNARTTAEKFYEKFGMKRYGEVFYPEGLGAHIVMEVNI